MMFLNSCLTSNFEIDIKSRTRRPGFTNPTGPVKPPPSGSGLPDRFDRKPVETGWIQIQIQNRMCNRFRPVYRPVWPVYRPGWPVYRPVWPVWDFFIFLNSNLNFELGPVDWFDRFTGRFDRCMTGLGIFIFLNSNLNFEFGPVWYRPKP